MAEPPELTISTDKVCQVITDEGIAAHLARGLECFDRTCDD